MQDLHSTDLTRIKHRTSISIFLKRAQIKQLKGTKIRMAQYQQHLHKNSLALTSTVCQVLYSWGLPGQAAYQTALATKQYILGVYQCWQHIKQLLHATKQHILGVYNQFGQPIQQLLQLNSKFLWSTSAVSISNSSFN